MGKTGNKCALTYGRRKELVRKKLASWYLPYKKVEDIKI